MIAGRHAPSIVFRRRVARRVALCYQLPMPTRFDFDAQTDFATAERKQQVTREVFAKLAPAYDHFSAPLSFWRDRAWKRDLVAGLPAHMNPACLDLACGTGDLCFLLAARYPNARILGTDITEAMLALARQRNQYSLVDFANADMLATGQPAASFDIVTGGYALRNAPDLDRALAEIARVLKPGGAAAFLDFSNPPQPFLRAVFKVLLRLWGGAWGLCLYGNPKYFTYITASLHAFPDRVELRRRLAAHSLSTTGSRLHMLGLLETIFVQKTG
jgi:demethylmenaquinone methyltransferase/2-methoxy-6-polyprenyl-1,4-benzoquinol methylase